VTRLPNLIASALPGDLNDLFALDLDQLEWTNLTEIAVGTAPAPRFGLGLAAIPGKLLVFGGAIFQQSGFKMY
jgi:hypothetical protein